MPNSNPERPVSTDTTEVVPEHPEHSDTPDQEDSNDIVHEGSCHCGKVKWVMRAPRVLQCVRCNCSICKKKSLIHYIVKREKFTLVQGGDKLKTYTFNTGVAQHRFCKKCGVQSFYIPRSNPNSISVMPNCIDSNTVDSIELSDFEGQNWDEAIKLNPPSSN
ncbi:hypothetical protein WR25_14855 [Diploscapter pachys]|uniref:CENP-V/GFA domain-containing protein n=1 Tax=Diploscapter pachys TaxID=2018661 RepID=A0A2A2KN47_9BILA|nr:hypothetical protein WR25_14855 [Diploscapter pachys]